MRRRRDVDAFANEDRVAVRRGVAAGVVEGDGVPVLFEALPCAVGEVAEGAGGEDFEERHGVSPAWGDKGTVRGGG